MTFDRRHFLGSALASGVALGASACVPLEQSPSGRTVGQLRIIESLSGGTLGVGLYDTGSKASIGFNADQRFGHCSSFKLSLAAKVLAEDARGLIDADRRVMWSEEEVVFHSPFTKDRTATGATLRELAEFTQKTSDNTAANVLLRELGGPKAMTGFWRTIGDDVSRLDRLEPAVNNVPPTEIRDTTTPEAMARTVAKLLYGDVMPQTQRATLRQWMIDSKTGLRRVRAGVAKDWASGDKTGTVTWPSVGSLYVDIGFVEPPDRAPITFATYLRKREVTDGIDASAEASLARVGEVITALGKGRGGFPL